MKKMEIRPDYWSDKSGRKDNTRLHQENINKRKMLARKYK